MTSLDQLSVAEFSGEQTNSKVYEKGHEKVLGIWFDLVLKVKCSTILIFKVIVKNQPNLYNLFSLKNKEEKLLFLAFLDTFDF